MLRGLQKAAPWVGVYLLSIVVIINATRVARGCLLHRQVGGISDIKIGTVHRAGVSFWGLYCERSEPSLKRAVF